jgi:hypothetical protein
VTKDQKRIAALEEQVHKLIAQNNSLVEVVGRQFAGVGEAIERIIDAIEEDRNAVKVLLEDSTSKIYTG